MCVYIANRFYFDLLHQYLLRLNGGPFFYREFSTLQMNRCDEWLVDSGIGNQCSRFVRTRVRTTARANGRSRSARQRLCAKDVQDGNVERDRERIECCIFPAILYIITRTILCSCADHV